MDEFILQPKAPSKFLRVELWQGTKFFFQLFPAKLSGRDEWKRFEWFELPVELGSKPIKELEVLYYNKALPGQAQAQKKPKWETDLVFREKFLLALAGMIQTSNQEGEVANAKVLFRQVTGKDWQEQGAKA